MDHQVKDQSSLHRYRTEIPNIILEMDLSVYAMRLYLQLKKVTGDGGKCYYTTRQLAEFCKMSVGAISKAKKELLDADLIRIERDGQWVRDNITLVDMWPANFAQYAQENSERACSPHEQGQEKDCSPHEQTEPQPVHHMNSTVHAVNAPVHHMNTKEEPIKNKPTKEEPKEKTSGRKRPAETVHPNTRPILEAYVEALGYKPGNYGQEAKAAKQLAKEGYEPSDVAAAYALLKEDPFWRTKHLSLQTLIKEMPAMRHALLQGVPLQKQTGKSTVDRNQVAADEARRMLIAHGKEGVLRG